MELPVFQPARLKDLREAKRLRTQIIAKLAGVSQGAITKAENGTSSPGSATLARIARALDAPMEYFFQPGRDPNPRRSATEMSYRFFLESGEFTQQQRQRCAAAIAHDRAPVTQAEWVAFCEMVNLVLGAPDNKSNGLELVEGKRKARR